MTPIEALIVTRGRGTWLKRCIESLIEAARRAELSDFSVLVGVNGEDADTCEVLKLLSAAQQKPSARIRYVQLSEDTPAGARNPLIERARGQWILFIDDDAFVDADFFLRFQASLELFPTASVIGGPNLTPPDAGSFAQATGSVLACRFATFASSARYRPVGQARACNESSLILCNLFVRKSALGELRFPRQLLCAEENWLLARLKRGGSGLVYDPALWVWHERRSTLGLLLRQLFKYGTGRGQQIRLMPRTLTFAQILPVLCLLYSPWMILSIARGGLFPWGIPLVAYAALCLHFGLRCGTRPLLKSLLFPAIHICYGLGVLAGLIRPGSLLVRAQTDLRPADKRASADPQSLSC